MTVAEELFGVLARVIVVTAGVLFLVTVAEFVLGVYLLQRGGGRLPARALAAYLMLQPFTFGLVLLSISVTSESFEFRGYLQELGARDVASPFLASSVAIGFLPALLLVFALSYPALSPRLRPRALWLSFPYIPSAAIGVVAVASASASWQPGLPGHLEPATSWTFSAGLIYLVVGTVLAGVLLWVRSQQASTLLERKRLRYMVRVIAVPTAAVAVFFLGTRLLGGTFESDVAFLATVVTLQFAILALVLVPAFGMAYGLLRYRVVEFETVVRRTFRITISQSFVAALFVVVYFAVSEAASFILVDRTQSVLIGVSGASLLVLALVPLERYASRLAKRAVPPEDETAKYREFRKWEVYRATYEELSVDRVVTPRERRALESLARTLGLGAGAAATVEREVDRERAGPAPRSSP